MALDTNEGWIIQKRTGIGNDKFPEITHNVIIINGKGILKEVPNQYQGVSISDDTTFYGVKSSGLPDSNTIVVDFSQGIILTDSSLNNKTLTVTFYGEGVPYLSASRVYVQRADNPDLFQTLQDLVDAQQTAIQATSDLAAVKADFLDKSSYDTNNDGKVNYADHADNADHATNADNATNAANADKVGNQALSDLDNRYSKVASSTTNGNIKINNTETNVYTHPNTHSADMITDGTTNASYTLAERSRLANSAFRQALINGNFDIWQRGTSFSSPANNAYTADRWKVISSGTIPSVTVSRQTASVDDFSQSKYFARLALTAGSPDKYHLTQPIENGITKYNNLKITVTLKARSSIAGKRLGVDFTCNYGTGGSPSASDYVVGGLATLTSSFQTYSFTVTVPSASGKTLGSNNDESLNLNIWSAWNATNQSRVGATTAETFSAGNIDIAQVQVYVGDTVINIQPRLMAEELLLCQRYFEKSYDLDIAPGTATAAGCHSALFTSSGGMYSIVKYTVRKRVKPTVKAYSTVTGAVDKIRDETTNVDATIGYTSTANGETTFFPFASPTAPGDVGSFQWTADAEL